LIDEFQGKKPHAADRFRKNKLGVDFGGAKYPAKKRGLKWGPFPNLREPGDGIRGAVFGRFFFGGGGGSTKMGIWFYGANKKSGRGKKSRGGDKSLKWECAGAQMGFRFKKGGTGEKTPARETQPTKKITSRGARRAVIPLGGGGKKGAGRGEKDSWASRELPKTQGGQFGLEKPLLSVLVSGGGLGSSPSRGEEYEGSTGGKLNFSGAPKNARGPPGVVTNPNLLVFPYCGTYEGERASSIKDGRAGASGGRTSSGTAGRKGKKNLFLSRRKKGAVPKEGRA